MFGFTWGKIPEELWGCLCVYGEDPYNGLE